MHSAVLRTPRAASCHCLLASGNTGLWVRLTLGAWQALHVACTWGELAALRHHIVCLCLLAGMHAVSLQGPEGLAGTCVPFRSVLQQACLALLQAGAQPPTPVCPAASRACWLPQPLVTLTTKF